MRGTAETDEAKEMLMRKDDGHANTIGEEHSLSEIKHLFAHHPREDRHLNLSLLW